MAIIPAQIIQNELAGGRLIKNADPANIEACSYDLRIGTVFFDGQSINNSQGNSQNHVLSPGGMLSMFTLEELHLPDNICATVFPINKQSSRGLLVLNPGHIDPGYTGPVSIRVLNISKQDMLIKHGEPIFTVVFDRLESATDRPYKNSSYSRTKLEKNFAENDLNVSPASLKKLVGEPNSLEIEKLIRNHWMSWTTLVLTAAAAVLALVAALPVFKDAKEKLGSNQEEKVAGPKAASKESVVTDSLPAKAPPLLDKPSVEQQKDKRIDGK